MCVYGQPFISGLSINIIVLHTLMSWNIRITWGFHIVFMKHKSTAKVEVHKLLRLNFLNYCLIFRYQKQTLLPQYSCSSDSSSLSSFSQRTVWLYECFPKSINIYTCLLSILAISAHVELILVVLCAPLIMTGSREHYVPGIYNI